MTTGDQILCHFIGDYVIQSDWMANEKTKKFWVALVHAVSYAIPFLALQPSAWSLVVMILTHAVIDRFRLARYLCWLKNHLAPESEFVTWELCAKTGYPDSRPPWMTVWLMIIADNTLHILINGLAMRYL